MAGCQAHITRSGQSQLIHCLHALGTKKFLERSLFRSYLVHRVHARAQSLKQFSECLDCQHGSTGCDCHGSSADRCRECVAGLDAGAGGVGGSGGSGGITFPFFFLFAFYLLLSALCTQMRTYSALCLNPSNMLKDGNECTWPHQRKYSKELSHTFQD